MKKLVALTIILTALLCIYDSASSDVLTTETAYTMTVTFTIQEVGRSSKVTVEYSRVENLSDVLCVFESEGRDKIMLLADRVWKLYCDENL